MYCYASTAALPTFPDWTDFVPSARHSGSDTSILASAYRNHLKDRESCHGSTGHRCAVFEEARSIFEYRPGAKQVIVTLSPGSCESRRIFQGWKAGDIQGSGVIIKCSQYLNGSRGTVDKGGTQYIANQPITTRPADR